MATCPLKSLPEWKELVKAKGETLAYFYWDKYEGDVSKMDFTKTEHPENPLIDHLYNKIIAMDKQLILHLATPTDKRHYTFNGERVAMSVTEKTKLSNKMPERTPTQKIEDEQKSEWGTTGHSFMENYITKNLIDEKGYAREEFLNETIDSLLNPSIQNNLKTFARELIRSYNPGTRFLIEKKVINTKEKGMLASTIDFKAIEPVETNGKMDIKIDTLDWKFMSIDKTREEDIPWYKRKDWIPQMGEYNKIDREYGATTAQFRKSRMIPFQLNYEYNKNKLYPASIEIGNLDNLKETKLYLLPVPSDTESTGIKANDILVKSLEQYYNKLANKKFSPEEKFLKGMQLGELSKAIRTLRMQQDFSQLYNVGKTFMDNANKAFKEFEGIDYSNLTQDDVSKKLEQLLEFKDSAEKFATIDETYLLNYPKETLNDEGKKILIGLESISGATGRMMNKIAELQKEYVVQLALKERVTTEENKESILSPEKEIKGLAGSITEPSKLGSRIINLTTNLLDNFRSSVNIEMGRLLNEFGDILVPLEKLAKSQGKLAFDYIGKVDNGHLSLIKKVDKEFWNQISEAKQAKNKQFLLDNLNLKEYNKLAKVTIEKRIEQINDTRFSTEETDNIERRKFEIEKAKNSLEIESDNFNGYNSGYFAHLFNKTMLVEKHYSQEYKELLNNKEALEVWNFFTLLNERGMTNGYLSYKGSSFFALIEASMLQKLSASSDLIKESGDLFKDLYKMRINEENQYSKIDPETGKPKKAIPKLFTRTDKDVHQLSRDLTKVGTLWVKALLEYESARRMEMTLLTLTNVERAKGHLVTDESNIPISINGELQTDLTTNKNADIMQTIVDDNIYGEREDLASIGGKSLSFITNKLSKEGDVNNEKATSIKKGMESMNMLTQSLAVGLKATIAIPNYFGNHFQSFINNGGMYTYSEFFKNHLKMVIGNLSTIQKGLIDILVPLNGDPYMEARRKIAWKQGYIKWLGTWTMQEAMMSTNYLPERNLQFTNALSNINNAIVINGRIINARQYLQKLDKVKYTKNDQGEFITSQGERKSLEKTFNKRVEELKDKYSLEKTAKIENDKIVIPDVSEEELARFRTKIVEWGRNLNGQMSQENKAGYRRDVMLKSLAMFRNWIPKQISVRGHDIRYNLEIEEWEYGRTRAFAKTVVQLGMKNIFNMFDIIRGTDKGLAILDKMLDQKREEYYKKTGNQLEITPEEYYDMMRMELSNEMKELGMLFGLIAVVLGAKLVAPNKDEDLLTKNKYKYFAKIVNKISNEVDFYYDPMSFVTMTKGNFLPAMGLLVKAQKVLTSLGSETYGYATNNQQLIDKSYPVKYFLDLMPVTSQFEREWLPLIDPELAREMGIKVITQPRVQQ